MLCQEASSVALSDWVDNSRRAAILGSCPKSLRSVAAGIRSWEDYVEEVLKPAGRAQQTWPPSLNGLLSWCRTFRHPKTLSNYLWYARTGCLVAGADDTVFSDPVLGRAKLSVKKLKLFRPRKKMFIDMTLLKRVVDYARWQPRWAGTTRWMVTACAFLLRVP